MNLSQVEAPDQTAEVNSDMAALGSRQLSVAEIQQALRALQSRKSSGAATPLASEPAQVGVAFHGGEAPPTRDCPSSDPWLRACWPAASVDGLDEQWVSVVAAHPGAGASTVALAIADACAAAGRGTHLLETAHPRQSGLVAAADSELGLDPSGTWRRGSRGRVTIHRRANNDLPAGWPALPASADDLVVIDLGFPALHGLNRLATSDYRTVVVFRPTVPGVRQIEQLLDAVGRQVILAFVGGSRWPVEVSASLGPRLRELRERGAVVTVPIDRRLEVTGLTSSPLPKTVITAGRSLLGLIDAARSGETTVAALSAPGRKGTDR